MSSVYSTRFIAAHAGATTVYTCPDGFKAVVRCVTAFNASAVVAETANLIHVNSDVTIWYAPLSQLLPPPPGAYATDELRFVFEAGESIKFFGDGDIDFSCTGYLLTLP